MSDQQPTSGRTGDAIDIGGDWLEDPGSRYVPAAVSVLAEVFTRFLIGDRHESEDPFVWDDSGRLVIDGWVNVTPAESEVIARLTVRNDATRETT
jgi:hypothetical protein